MKQSTLILILSLFFSPLVKILAQEENYDAVFQSLIKEYTLNEDGTIDFRYAKTLKLQNYRSFHRLYGETFIVYNPDYQKLEVNQSYTVMADGKKVITPENAFIEVLPYFAAHAPAYNRFREMVIVHTGLEIGSTIFLDYRIHTEKDLFPAFMGCVVLAEEQPVNSMTVVIRTPIDQPVFFHPFNLPVKPSETIENGLKVYTWVLNSLPAMESEKFQANSPGIYPALLFGSLDSYQSVVGFFTDQDAFRYHTNPEMDKFVDDLSLKNLIKSDLVFAIQESVVKEMNLFGVPDEITGYRLHTPVEVWNSNGGTASEKAVLMATLLKHAGIQADPVMIFPGNLFDPKIGDLTNLKEWAVRTDIPELGIVYLSVKQINAFDLMELNQRDVFMVLNGDRTFQIVYPEQTKAELSMKGVFVIDTVLNLSGELSGTLSGAPVPYLSLVRNKDKLKQYLHGGIASAKLTEISFSELTPGETSFTCNLDKKDVLKKDSNMYYLSVPSFSTGIDSWDVSQLPTQRQTPVEVPSAIKESYNFTFAIPGNLRLLSGEQEIRITNKAGSLLYLVKEKGNVIQVQKEIDIEGRSIGKEDYFAFRELMNTWSLWQTNHLIFRK